MTPYADTNFFSTWLLDLPQREHVFASFREAKRGGATPLPITQLLKTEFTNATERLVFESRNGQPHGVNLESASIARATFLEYLEAGVILQAQQLDESLLHAMAEQLILRHTARHGFRTYDVLHVSSALLLGCDSFWSFDAGARRLAALEGLRGS